LSSRRRAEGLRVPWSSSNLWWPTPPLLCSLYSLRQQGVVGERWRAEQRRAVGDNTSRPSPCWPHALLPLPLRRLRGDARFGALGPNGGVASLPGRHLSLSIHWSQKGWALTATLRSSESRLPSRGEPDEGNFFYKEKGNLGESGGYTHGYICLQSLRFWGKHSKLWFLHGYRSRPYPLFQFIWQVDPAWGVNT
jgi:hypothetical protein